jgi:hypothetical protein
MRGFWLVLLATACSNPGLATNTPTPCSEIPPTYNPITRVYKQPLTPVPDSYPDISRHPEPSLRPRHALPQLPAYDPSSTDYGQVDLRSRDISKLDLTQSLSDLLYADFDSRTIWPPSEMLPKGFDYHQTMGIDKNPGLGIRRLQELGITNSRAGIAIIDPTLLVDHQEHARLLQLYEEMDDIKDGPGSSPRKSRPGFAGSGRAYSGP